MLVKTHLKALDTLQVLKVRAAMASMGYPQHQIEVLQTLNTDIFITTDNSTIKYS